MRSWGSRGISCTALSGWSLVVGDPQPPSSGPCLSVGWCCWCLTCPAACEAGRGLS